MKIVALCAAFILWGSLVPGEEPKPAPDAPAPPAAEIRRINITVYPDRKSVV
jgi:hypothetical protein